ncbi:MAG: DUF2442 domain-containing protein [Bacilli bacterium]
MDLQQFRTFIQTLDTTEQKQEFANLIAVFFHNQKKQIEEEFFWELRSYSIYLLENVDYLHILHYQPYTFFSVKALDNYILEIMLDTGKVKYFNMQPYLDYPIFEPLKDINIFKKVYLDDLEGIEWDLGNGASLSKDTLVAKMY